MLDVRLPPPHTLQSILQYPSSKWLPTLSSMFYVHRLTTTPWGSSDCILPFTGGKTEAFFFFLSQKNKQPAQSGEQRGWDLNSSEPLITVTKWFLKHDFQVVWLWVFRFDNLVSVDTTLSMGTPEQPLQNRAPYSHQLLSGLTTSYLCSGYPWAPEHRTLLTLHVVCLKCDCSHC